MKQRVYKTFTAYLWLTLASAVYALGFNWCYAPNLIGFGGITGWRKTPSIRSKRTCECSRPPGGFTYLWGNRILGKKRRRGEGDMLWYFSPTAATTSIRQNSRHSTRRST